MVWKDVNQKKKKLNKNPAKIEGLFELRPTFHGVFFWCSMGILPQLISKYYTLAKFWTQSHRGLVQMTFLFSWLIFRFQPLIFRGVPSEKKTKTHDMNQESSWLVKVTLDPKI